MIGADEVEALMRQINESIASGRIEGSARPIRLLNEGERAQADLRDPERPLIRMSRRKISDGTVRHTAHVWNGPGVASATGATAGEARGGAMFLLGLQLQSGRRQR